MGDLSYIQRIARHYYENMVPCPAYFDIHNDYLLIDKEDFIAGFRCLYDLLQKIFLSIQIKPQSFDMPIYDAIDEHPKGKEFSNSSIAFNRLLKTIYCLASCATIKNSEFVISYKDFMKMCKKMNVTKPREILSKFCDFGFVLKGIDKICGSHLSSFGVAYPKNSNMLTVLKAITNIQLKKPENSTRLSMEYLARADYRVFTQAKGKAPKYTIDDIIKPLSEKDKFIALKLNELAEKVKCYIDVKCSNLLRGKWKCSYKLRSAKRTFFTLGVRENKLFIKINLVNIQHYIDRVSKCPDTIINIIKKANDCGECEYHCPLKPQFNLEGKHYKKCVLSSFYFYDVQEDQLPYLIDLLNEESKY